MVGVASCAGFLLALARPALPGPPVLSFDPARVAAVEAADEAALARAAGEPSGPAAEVWRLYHAAGLAEVGSETREAFEARQEATAAAVAALREAEGDEALATLRARALAELEAGLAGELDGEAEAAALGSFPATTETYGVFEEGRPVAPALVVRTLFAARFNGIVGLDLTADMSAVERKAYWGWLALEAPDPPPQLLARALEELDEVAPRFALEVRAHRALTAGHAAEAAAFYGRLPTLRGRNAALAAHAGVL